MRKFVIFFFLLLILFLNISCEDTLLGSGNLGSGNLGSGKLNSGKTFEERLKEEDLDNYEPDHSMENQMKELIKEYIQDNEWTPEQQIDAKIFKKMFVNLIQRGALRQSNTDILKALADKILEKHGEPILVKNLENYFNIEELTLTYSKLLTPNSDL